MISVQRIDGSCQMVPVILKNISPHDDYERFNEILAGTNYLLPSSGILSVQALKFSLLMHPIMVIKAKQGKERYFCVGGIRSLLLAQSTLNPEQELSVTLLDRLRSADITVMINTDVLLSPLLHSIRNPATIGKIHQLMGQVELQALFSNGSLNKSNLARYMTCARNTVFPPRNHKTGKAGDAS